MQPTCRQVPPRNGSFSTTIVFSPSSPARMAATYPPGPLPMIATSYFATRCLPSERLGPFLALSRCCGPRGPNERGLPGSRCVRHPPQVPQPDTKRLPPQARTAATQQTQEFSSRPMGSQPAAAANRNGRFYSCPSIALENSSAEIAPVTRFSCLPSFVTSTLVG